VKSTITWFLALVLAIALSVTPAHARTDAVFTNGSTTVTLFDTACEVKAVLSQIPPQYQASFKTAKVVHGGKDFAACWVRDASGTVYVFDETGDGGALVAPFVQANVA
jgi:hypothetical protein